MQYKTQIQPRRVLIILLLSLSALVACSGPDDRQMVQTAKNYLGEQKIREASIELRDALRKNPNNAEARYLLGQIDLDIGDSEAAEKEFRRAREAGWQEEEAQIGLARALIHVHKFQDLLDNIKIKEEYSPVARANLYGLHAAAQAGLGKMKMATETLATGARIDANALHLLKYTLQLQLSRKNLEGATKTLKQALSVHPDNPELLLLSAIAAIQSQDMEGAMDAYQKVISQEPPRLFTVYSRNARLKLIRMEIIAKNLDQAQATLAPLIERDGNNPETNYLAGMLAFAKGHYQGAGEYLLKVLKRVPKHTQTQLLFGTVSYAQQNYEQAAYYISKYLSVVPENLDARKLLGRTYIMLGQHGEAQATLQTVLKKGGNEDAELLALVGFSQLQGGDTTSGIEGLEHALKVAPESPDLRRELAKAYISAGETDQAIQQLEIILAESHGEQQTEKLLVIAHLRAENFDRAINTVLEILARKPEDPIVLAWVGNVFIASGDKPEARRYFKQALQISPALVSATMSLAHLEELEGHYAEAETLYQGIIGADAKSIAPLLALAHLAELQGKTEKMFDWLEQARKQSPKDIKPRVLLAEYYLREKQVKKADLLVKEAMNIGSRQPMLIALQGRVLMANKRYNEALPLLNGLVTREPESVLSRGLLAETYLELGQIKDARRQLEIILEKQPYYVPALVLISRAELQSGHYAQVPEYAEQIQKTRPDLYIGHELAGDSWIARKDYTAAKMAYTQAWDLKPSTTLAIKLAETLKRSGKPQKATAVLIAWLNDHPSDARVLQFLGTTYQDLKQNDKAIQAYEKVLAVRPNNIVSLNNLAWLYSLSNNPKALELAARAYQENTDNAGIQDTYGWILVQQGQADKGRHLLKQAMEKLPKVAEVRYHYAVALLKSGKTIEARKMLNRLMQEDKSFVGREDAQQLLRNGS